MYEIWYLNSDGVTPEFHPTAQSDVGAWTMGKFLTNYLAENGRKILILGQISINGSVKMLSSPYFHITNGPNIIENIWSTHDATDWGHGGTYNQNWLVILGGTYQNVSVAWRGTDPSCLSYMPRIWEMCTLLRAASVITPFVAGVVRIWVVPSQVETRPVVWPCLWEMHYDPVLQFPPAEIT